MHRWVCAAVLVAAVRVVDAAPEPTAEPSLAGCAAQLAQDGPELAEACPDIDRVIAASPFAGVSLPGGRPSRAHIAALDRLISAFGEPRADHALDTSTLDAILTGLRLDEQPKSLWELFTAWFDDRWQEFVDWLPPLPNPLAKLAWPSWGFEFFRAIAWGTAAMLVAAAVVLLAGIVQAVRRRSGWVRAVGKHGNRRTLPRAVDLTELEQGPAVRRIRLLLKWMLAELSRTGRLVGHAALTHRQLVGATRNLSTTQQQAFGRVAALAERVTYSCFEPPDEEVGAVVAQGRALVLGGES